MESALYNYSYNLLFDFTQKHHMLIWNETDREVLRAHKYQCVSLQIIDGVRKVVFNDSVTSPSAFDSAFQTLVNKYDDVLEIDNWPLKKRIFIWFEDRSQV